ncbi:MAG: hypothetical protein ABH860_04515 [bacterium]
MKKSTFILLVIGIWSLVIASAAYAATSANYAISAEVIDLGGASMESTGYLMFGKLRENVPEVITSASYTLEGRFLGIVYGAGTVSTIETPVVASIDPASGYNNRAYRVIINGSNISTDATASLTASSHPTIDGTTVSIESSTSMECTFDLTEAAVGARNVTVTNTGYGASGSLAGGFTIISPGRVAVVGTPFNEPNPFNPSTGATTIKYTLNTSSTITLYLFNQKGEIIWQKTIPAGENGGVAGNNTVPWDAVSDFREEVPSGVYVLSIVSKTGGASRELSRVKIAVIRR